MCIRDSLYIYDKAWFDGTVLYSDRSVRQRLDYFLKRFGRFERLNYFLERFKRFTSFLERFD